MSKMNRFKKLAQKSSNEKAGGDVTKEAMITQTESETFTETKSPEIVVPQPKIKFEKLRKRTTFWVKESDIKVINKLSKKMGIPKYEVIENAINYYAEAVNHETGTS